MGDRAANQFVVGHVLAKLRGAPVHDVVTLACKESSRFEQADEVEDESSESASHVRRPRVY